MDKFQNAKDAWFWFMRVNETLSASNYRSVIRERKSVCDPMDILQALDRLIRTGHLKMDHALILRKYGRLGRMPDPSIPTQVPAFRLWTQAINALQGELEKKGIVQPRRDDHAKQ